ncbi:MAG: DUF4411 family protein [Acidimicrobiales bacterium]
MTVSYVFDTSALITAWTEQYPPDTFPALWDSMDGLVQHGRLKAPEEVLKELKSQDDVLHGWVTARTGQMVVPTSRAVMLEVSAILADHEHLTKTGPGRGKADPFVIALAAQSGCPVVTQERGGTASKPKIPYVCGQRGVPCMNVLAVLRAEGWSF